LVEIQRELEEPDVWNDPERAQQLGRERARLEEVVDTLGSLENGLRDAEDLLAMARYQERHGKNRGTLRVWLAAH